MSNEKPLLPYYRISSEQSLEQLNTTQKGLGEKQAKNLLTEFGNNQLKQVHKTSWVHRYLRLYKDLMIVLLLFSSALSLYLGDYRTSYILLALVLFNTGIGFLQEFKAERIMEGLDRLVIPKAKVIRSGNLQEIDSTELVPGDVVYIEEGDSVPADLRLLDESELATNDFALTGESNPSRKFTHAISKEVPLGDRHNLLFMGTTVATGNGHGVVIGTGMRTELGRIANLSQDTPADISPLQKEMNNIATRVTQGTVILCSILLPIAIRGGLSYKEAFLFAIGIASSIIPQGLPAEINTTLAQAANKLAKARALVKKLSAVETLGATSIICTDKTGTLTKNQMTVEQFFIGTTNYTVSGSGYENSGQIHIANEIVDKGTIDDLELFFLTGVFASNAKVHPPDDEHAVWYTVGDPTEGALITLANKAGLDTNMADSKYPELKEFTFDSARKRMSSIRKWKDGNKLYVFVKGAPEGVLERCDDIWDHHHTRKLTPKTTHKIIQENISLAESAMRNLAYAYKILPANTDPKTITMEQAESGLTYLGMVSMIDPLRDEVPAAMTNAHKAHIKISIITGDHSITAKAIASKAGLSESNQNTTLVTGEDIRKLSDTQIVNLVVNGGVIFSRVSPEDKLRIVGLVKDSGHVIAVTGDGINDAPALKRADIGVAMGRTGTDVSKQSSEIVLLDDSFHTLISAIQQGRVVFQNIKKGALSCFTSNSAELIVNLTSLAAASLFHIPLALSVMQILAIDLIAELFPIAALGWDPADRELMQEAPRKTSDHILNRNTISDLLWCGLLIGGLAFINYLLLFQRSGIDPRGMDSGNIVHLKATSMTYLTIVLCQLGNIMQRRSQDGLFTVYQFNNKHLWLALGLSLFCVINVIYNPWIAPYFNSGALSITDWLFALSAAAIFIAVRELQRYTRQKSTLLVSPS